MQTAHTPAVTLAIANPLPVSIVTGEGSAPVVNMSYASTNVTTSAYVTLVASTSAAYKELDIFDSSGQALYLAAGAAGFEVNIFEIAPGGTFNRVPVSAVAGVPGIPASTRLSLKAITATASVGFIAINGYA